MKDTNETDALNEAIILLQHEQSHELKLLTAQFHETYQSLNPGNILKTVLQEVSLSPEIKISILNNVVALTTGYLSKKVLGDSPHNPIKKAIVVLLQFAVANVVLKNSDKVILTIENFLKRIFKYKNES